MTAPGNTTSEFRLVLVAVIIGALLIVTGLYSEKDAILYSGVAILTSAVPGYALSRGVAKRGNE